jgi:NADPH:quinone reductase-like Zn-dependent oxidoreductase
MYALSGKVNTQGSTSCLEFAGTVRRVGEHVDLLMEGDKVVVMAPKQFGTIAVVPSWACSRVRPNEDLNVCIASPLGPPTNFCLAGYGNRPSRVF